MRLAFATLIVCASIAANAQVKPFAPELFDSKISGAVCGFSADAKTIYFIKEDTVKKKLFIYQADLKRGKWTNARLLPFSGEHNDYGGRLSPDGKTLYFSSDRPGGSSRENDGWNLWKTTLNGNQWEAPQALLIPNNKGDECCPVPLSDGTLLYSGSRPGFEWQIFNNKEELVPALSMEKGWQWPSYFDAKSGTLLFNSMKRPDTKGMDDVYIATLKDGKWVDVKNLAEINTSGYEDGAILSPDRKLLIFNRHETHSTPSQVLCVPTPSFLQR